MAKTKKPQGTHRTQHTTAKTTSLSGLREKKESDLIKYQNYIYIALIILLVVIFFSEGIFSGKIFASADNLSPFSFKTYLDDARRDGIFPLWVPYIFGGMPSLAAMLTGLPSAHNFFSYIFDNVLNGIAGDNAFFLTLPYYMFFGISLYAYTRYKFKNNTIALFCALTGVIATPIIQLIITGHHTKMMTFAFVPLILLIIDWLIDTGFKNKFRVLFNFALLAIIVYIQLHFHHIQMLFYSYLMIGIYFIYIVIYKLISKEQVKPIIVALSVFIASTIFALAMDADIIMSIKEYNKYSIRGVAAITAETQSTGAAQPLDYQYATNWSFSPGEVLTFFIPYYYGFGGVEIEGQRQNLYWGQMPFTDSPVYFGVIVLLLAIIGIIFNFRRNVSVQAFTFIIFVFLLLSFGRNWSLLYDMFYNYVPFFSSFRAPVMIHYYMDLIFVVLAGFGIKTVIEAAKDNMLKLKMKRWSLVFWGIAGLMLIFSVIGFESSYKESVLKGPKATEYLQQGASPQQINQQFSQVAAIAYENVLSDLRLHAFLIALVVALIYFYTQGKLKQSYFYTGIILIAVFDLWNLSAKTLHWDAGGEKEQLFAKSDYVNFVLNKDPNTYLYRVADMDRGQLATGNFLAYYRLHQINGYHGAKIRIYQDMIDVVGGDNPNFLALADVKYIFSNAPLQDTNFVPVFKGKQKAVYENKRYLPRAFFVDEYKVESGLQILNNIRDGNFDPSKVAFVEQNINQQISKPDSTAYANLVSANIHNLEYDINATGNNMLVFSEIYYPAGWKAYIDGQETPIYKTDYLFRSIVVPPGKHKVEMRFYPETYYAGKNISLIANIIILLALLTGAYMSFFRKEKDNKSEIAIDNPPTA